MYLSVVRQEIAMSSIHAVATFTRLDAAPADRGATEPVLEPITQNFIDTLAVVGSPPIYTLTPEAARKVLSNAQAGPDKGPPADIEERKIPVGPKGWTCMHLVRPQGVKERLPVVMYFHGGGWVLGGFDTHERLVREIAHGAHVAVIFVDYALAPEHRYPVQIEEDYAATKYVVDHPDEFDIDGTRLAIAGDSVGGNMVAAVSLLAKEREGPPIAFQVMFYPVTNYAFHHGSYNEFENGPWLTRGAMKWFWNAYLPNPDKATQRNPLVSPLQASLEQLQGLPPALVITDENDVLRDEGEAYAHKLAEAGVSVTSVRYNGTVHDFVMLNALADTPAARGAIAQASAALRAALA
jgi:acetyl esterase